MLLAASLVKDRAQGKNPKKLLTSQIISSLWTVSKAVEIICNWVFSATLFFGITATTRKICRCHKRKTLIATFYTQTTPFNWQHSSYRGENISV